MFTPTGPRESELLQAVQLLLDARRTRNPIDDLPEALKPTSTDEVVWIQDHVLEAYGPVGGWKVGAPSLEATPMAAPMPAAWIAASGALVASRLRGVEAEIAFLLQSDLPARTSAYTREEVYAAVGSCHPVIEVIDSAFTGLGVASPTSESADLQVHGGLIYGAAIPDWQTIDFHTETATLIIDGIVRVERTGSNTSGDLLRLLPWLASEAASRTGGLRAGQWITTGSWTGCTRADKQSSVTAHFSTAGDVNLRFE